MAACKNELLSGLPAGRQLAWLRRVARNKAVDRYRHTARLTMLPLEQARETEDEGLTLEQHAERRETYQHLSQTLGQLSPIHTEIIRLRHVRALRLALLHAAIE